jgi:tetratricopeptide (TPR) repeat protein
MEEWDAIRAPDLYKANQALKQMKYHEAASLYHDYIESHKPLTTLNEPLARAYNGLGWSQYHKGQYRNAIEKFKRSKKYKKLESNSVRGMGLSQFHLKNYRDAVTYLKFIRDKYPDEQQGQYELDWSILRSWGDNRARQYFERELRVDPLRASLYMGMGWIHTKNSKPDLAVEFFLKAISLDPDSAVSSEFFNLLASQRFGWQVYNRLGWAYYHKRNYNRSLEMFQVSLKERPDKSGAHKGIGYNLFRMEKYASAIKYLEQALVINPATEPVMETVLDGESKDSLKIRTTARTKLARAYYQSGNYQKAVSYYQKDLAYYPELADAHAGLGWAYLKLHRLTESRAAFTESLKLAPLKRNWRP